MRQVFALTSGAILLALTVAMNAAETKDHNKRFRDAATVLDEIHRAPDKDIPNDLWEKASCVAVIPSVKKAAFVLGGEYGKGVMSCRDGSGWSAPSFMVLQKGSFGFQIGGETIDLILLVMNERGMKHMLEDKVALGVEASVAGGPVGRDTRAMTDAQMKAEILSYSRSQGLFAGIDLTGGVLKPDADANHDLYGAGKTPHDILIAKSVRTPAAAAPFTRALHRTLPPEAASKN